MLNISFNTGVITANMDKIAKNESKKVIIRKIECSDIRAIDEIHPAVITPLTAIYIPTYRPRVDFSVRWVQEAIVALRNAKHVLITGDSGLGKSVLIKYYCETLNYEGVVFLPSSTTDFEFGDVHHNTAVAVAIHINEDYLKKHRQALLHLLDGGVASVNHRNIAIRSLSCSTQFIFTSNFHGIGSTDTALQDRLVTIEADRIGFKTDN